MLKKVIKYIFKPHILILIMLRKLRNIFRISFIRTISSAKGINIKLGDKVIFNQKMIISGSGSIVIGSRCSFGFNNGGYYYKGACELQPRYKEARIIIGNNVHVNNNLFICNAGELTIGDNTLIGEGVMILDYEAHGIHPSERNKSCTKVKKVEIGINVWIGSRVTILPGTKIGNNSIVGAGAVVKGEFPDNVIIAGNPARVIRKII